MKKPRIYIGCALTGTSKKHRKFIQNVKDELKKKFDGKVVILEFLGLTKGTDVDVYDFDIGHVKNCDALVGFIGKSFGLGYEVATFVEAKRRGPFLILHQQDWKPMRLVTGMVKRHEQRGVLLGYSSVKTAVDSIIKFLSVREII